MKIGIILNTHYDVNHQKDLVALLHKHHLYQSLEQITAQFNMPPKPGNLVHMQTQVNKLVKRYFALAAHWFESATEENQRKKDAGQVFCFITKLISEAIHQSQLSKVDYYTILMNQLQAEPVRILWKEFAFNFFLGVIEECFFIREIHASCNQAVTQPSAATYFTWVVKVTDKENRISLETFIMELCETFPGLKSANKIALLFKNTATDFKITIPPEHLGALLMLFYQLHCARRIRCNNSRGLIKHLQLHLQAPPHQQLPLRKKYAKLNNEVLKDTTKRLNIFRQISPMHQKYCS
ncbi:MAG: hypothetical protein WCQ95_08730 [Bacteroidota bacterium]